MAFNFNWSPLTADANFYQRAQEMLTTALNKSPKPPIIVDDIIVNELNLGSVPPDLEILEIGDLAEDRFRGIFKMCYSGDAFLTLKTRVQANPMNTYLFSKPLFTSPQPLAAASGLTIPLQITLSEIKLSAFIILVFSRLKGLTLVFRNDPLESLKVSSTFDSIPFVRDYLQKEIEMQLRTLMMDELPAIIHRLSLQLWCPEHSTRQSNQTEPEARKEHEIIIDPFASPPQDAVDSRGNVLDANEISSLSLDGSPEIQSLFSQQNLLRLAALRGCHRTLSLFTPSINDIVYRALASPSDRSETAGSSVPGSPCLRRSHSSFGSTVTAYTPSRLSDDGNGMGSHSSCSSINSLPSTTGLSLGCARSTRSHMHKKKNRIFDLRKPRNSELPVSDTCATNSKDPLHEPAMASPKLEDKILEPSPSPSRQVRFQASSDETEPEKRSSPLAHSDYLTNSVAPEMPKEVSPISVRDRAPLLAPMGGYIPSTKAIGLSSAFGKTSEIMTAAQKASVSRILLERAWILKMSEALNLQVHEKKDQLDPWPSEADQSEAPPAYQAEAL
ncbi:BgTH12-07768 [Blumeria graminis f. sp. triticale]|uniref:Mitochondrial distribution and morphology protein 34 n=3 Tax=Blumeria graminis TaxID=34373 RepID=A0A061HEQ5_BLUGR|nr:Mitochondrial outer membrane protein [Blumeria graminis f. sp. tritici 96224]CAD6506541.1 BgTH12-07768 [Blumeria graminis f. sp. triticale]VDB96395.1 Bgt-1907 [Blumeria graminis f. sp. tritici]